MEYVLHRDGRYYYNRRVPKALSKIDPRNAICVALKTDSRKEAAKLALLQNEQIENYWKSLIEAGQEYADSDFQDVIKQSRLIAFSQNVIPKTALNQFENTSDNPILFNIVKKPERTQTSIPSLKVSLEDALIRFWDYSKDKLLNKSPNQVRKWQHPRRRAIKNFKNCIGDKSITEVTREDTLKFRDWWITRIEKENLVTNSANKDIIHVKTILETLNDNLKLDIDIQHLFKKLRLVEDDERRRLPFESSFIVSTLLNPDKLKGLNEQARWVLHAIAETGAGISEQLGLMPEDIVLDAEIPHIKIVSRTKRTLKTKYRKRVIPLTGYALDAFKACPGGFTEYKDRPDVLSSVLGKFLSENNLLPTPRHSVYSLRHSFQDRILAVNTPDRIQAELMGHKFHRPSYGDGATLAHKLEWMRKFNLNFNP